MGSGLDGKEIGVSVRSRGTVAELITTAVEALKHRECANTTQALVSPAACGLRRLHPLIVSSTPACAIYTLTPCPWCLMHAETGAAVSYNNLRVTGLYSQAGRPLSAGHHLHSQGQVRLKQSTDPCRLY